jgi:hypothetical protein
MMAIYGWASPKEAALYTRRANRRKLAGDAMHLIRLEQAPSVPPAEPGSGRWDETTKKPAISMRFWRDWLPGPALGPVGRSMT